MNTKTNPRRANILMSVSASRFDTSILDHALAEKREHREALRHKTTASLRNALASVPVQYSAVYVFGSILTPGRFHEDSDVDLAFEGLSSADYFRAKCHLENVLERPVDVLQIENHRLRDIISQKGVRWTQKDMA